VPSLTVSLLFLCLISMGWAQPCPQDRMREEFSSRNPNNKTSSFAGKMFESKEIQIKRYEGGQSDFGKRLYASAESSDYDTRHQQAVKESPYSVQRSKFSESKRSDLDGFMQADLEDRQPSAFKKKIENQMSDLTEKEGPNWVTRRSPQYCQKNGELRMYEGRLIRVSEKVSREEDLNRRDIGIGSQEIFNPDEVQKILKPPKKQNELQSGLPLDPQVKAESRSASRPVVADSSLDSP